MRNTTTSTISPTITQTPVTAGMVLLLSLLRAFLDPSARSLLGPFFPSRHIGNPIVITRHHHFASFLKCRSVAAPRSRTAPHTSLRISDFAGTPFANRARHFRQSSGQLKISVVQFNLVRQQHLHKEPGDNRRSRKATHDREPKCQHIPNSVILREQVARAAKPGQKREPR